MTSGEVGILESNKDRSRLIGRRLSILHPSTLRPSILCLSILCLSLVALLLAGCYQRMEDQPKVVPYRASPLFDDSLGMRPLVPGTVAQTDPSGDALFYDGLEARPLGEAGVEVAAVEEGRVAPEAALATTFPFPVTAEVLARGRQRFDIYCSPCHGRLGDGQGMIVQRGLRPPPSYHTERLRDAPVGHFYNVVTNGYGAMVSYASRLAPADRWAIVAYVRALQLSQHASATDVPADTLAALRRSEAVFPSASSLSVRR